MDGWWWAVRRRVKWALIRVPERRAAGNALLGFECGVGSTSMSTPSIGCVHGVVHSGEQWQLDDWSPCMLSWDPASRPALSTEHAAEGGRQGTSSIRGRSSCPSVCPYHCTTCYCEAT